MAASLTLRISSLLLLLACAGCASDSESPDNNTGSGNDSPVNPGGDNTDDDVIPPDDTPFERRFIPEDVLARKAICYSGYRTGQSPETHTYPSKEQIKEDLQILVEGGWGLIRLFDSGTHAERTLEVIAEENLDLKVMLGVWISGPDRTQGTENQKQLEAGIALAKKYPDTVVAMSVGNEVLDDWSHVKTPVKDLVLYIRQVRKAVPLPVTTDDSYLPFLLGKDGNTDYANVIEVAKAVDFLSLHAYALADAFWGSWDWKQEKVPENERAIAMMNAAIAYTKNAIGWVRVKMAENDLPDIPIVIGEAGWKDTTKFVPKDAGDLTDKTIQYYFAHPVNQQYFYDQMMAWVYGDQKDASSPGALFYFEAFDEPWKDAYGDDNWGLFDVNRKAKFVMWEEFPDLKPEGAEEPSPESMVCWRP